MAWTLLALATLIGLVGVWRLAERRLIFPAPRLSAEALAQAARAAGAAEITVTAADGARLYGWHIARGNDRLALLFGGNGASVVGYMERHRHLIAAGFDVLQVHYRGYPGSEGWPHEAGLLMDARAAWEHARQHHPARRILVLGKSLGGGVAVGLVADLPPEETPAALVLESTFTSVRDVAARRYPWLPLGLLLRSPFPSLARAPRLRPPTLVLHSPADEVIPYAMGEALARAIPGAALVAIPGLAHNEPLFITDGGQAALRALISGSGAA